MTRIISILTVAIGLLLISGCGGNAAYQATATTAVSVDAAMNGWGDWVRAGQATDQDQARVRSAYEAYQATMLTMETVVFSYLDGGTDQTALNAAMGAAEASRLNLLNLIQTLRRQ